MGITDIFAFHLLEEVIYQTFSTIEIVPHKSCSTKESVTGAVFAKAEATSFD